MLEILSDGSARHHVGDEFLFNQIKPLRNRVLFLKKFKENRKKGLIIVR